jgi:L-ribulose-5-phosphate 3-epimerase
MIAIGINGRFFPNNWRSAIDEIRFCKTNAFQSLQFQGKEKGLNTEDLGASLNETAAFLEECQIIPVMEILLHLDTNGLTTQGNNPIQVLHANLNAIKTLKCSAVHWHLVAAQNLDREAEQDLEFKLRPQLIEAVQIAQVSGFHFGIEHNEPEQKLFNNPQACANVLEAIQGLGFVWDFNHTAKPQIDDYKKLISRMTMLHVSDSPLPETNYHLPLGLGNIDFSNYLCDLIAQGFEGSAILEIGGLPKSGGYNRDTDEALTTSKDHLHILIQSCNG